MTDPMQTELLPCPFCGKTSALRLITAEELANEGEDDPEPWQHTPTWAVICAASKPSGPGGCGASGGFSLSEEMAVAEWNSRSASELRSLRDALALAKSRIAELEGVVQECRPLLAHAGCPVDDWLASVLRSATDETGLTHTDHPMRHYDRTCPACNTSDSARAALKEDSE